MFTSSSAMRKIREDQVIHDSREMERYLKNFMVHGFSGTDFRPALLMCPSFWRREPLRSFGGLIYFTDGYGIFPVKMPPYDTVFVLQREDYQGRGRTAWAMKLSTVKIKYLLY
ncbi:MAG: hypothetical protein ACLR2E_16465 [Lachnospiraceae bacterium]